MTALARAAVGALIGICISSTESAGASIFEQAPCSTQDNPCVTIDPATSFPLKVRTFSFAAPARGKAQISFQGSMLCSSNNEGLAVVDLVTQIVMDQNAAPAINRPGGARHAAVLSPGPLGTSISFNLASTSAVTVPAGSSVATFSIRSLRMDEKTTCFLYNLAFSVVYIEDRN